MRKLLYYILIAGISISCKKDTPISNPPKTTTVVDAVKSDFDTLDYEMKKIEKRLVEGSDTTEIELNVPTFTTKSVVTDSINKLILQEMSSLFYFDTIQRPKNFDAICANFISTYNQVHQEDQEFTSHWQAYSTTSIDYQSPKLLNLVFDYWAYTGGAHGNGATYSYFIDAKTGKQIKKENLFSDLKGFTKLAEQKFRKQQNVPKNVNINETGYWFADEKFHLPQNIFLTKKGVNLLYNQYEVASYAEGPIEVVIPYTEANQYLKLK
ncbi:MULTISPECIES: DUF3298 domain-containing protein [unclassified Flavobacterium]|uniref:DUF3298 domain-containing protein n=1 Tax=unclassified Flavobacterium TaxID=196869 RepID=UPI0036173F62